MTRADKRQTRADLVAENKRMRRALLAIREHVGKVEPGSPETAFYRLGAIDSEATFGLGDPLALMPLGEVNHGK